MILDAQKVRKIDLSHFVDNITREDLKKWINAPAGYSHYKLLAHVAQQLNDSLIIDIGTHHGLSCLALSVNEKNKVITYDISDQKFGSIIPDNVERRVGNIFDLKGESILLDADFIFLDTAHLGDFELQVYEYLRDNNYKGFIIYDDIHFSNEMVNFWNKIPNDIKTDLTYMGHGEGRGQNPDVPGIMAGTGMVDFNNKVKLADKEEDRDPLTDSEKDDIKSALSNSIGTKTIHSGNTWWNQ